MPSRRLMIVVIPNSTIPPRIPNATRRPDAAMTVSVSLICSATATAWSLEALSSLAFVSVRIWTPSSTLARAGRPSSTEIVRAPSASFFMPRAMARSAAAKYAPISTLMAAFAECRAGVSARAMRRSIAS